MARGVRKGVESQIAELDAKIAKKRDEIKTLELKRNELVNNQQAELALKVVKYAADKGITVDELLKSLD